MCNVSYCILIVLYPFLITSYNIRSNVTNKQTNVIVRGGDIETISGYD